MQEIKTILYTILFVFSISISYSQNKINKLFEKQDILPLKLSFSNKKVKKTNDSTYIDTDLYYKNESDEWISFPLNLRARGNFRRKTCYFPPIKMKISKSVSKETLFKGNKKLKLVLPCKNEKELLLSDVFKLLR